MRNAKSEVRNGKARRSARATERRCIRCGCTESRACAGGCSWVLAGADVCTKCVSTAEMRVAMALQSSLDNAGPKWRPFYLQACRALAEMLSHGGLRHRDHELLRKWKRNRLSGFDAIHRQDFEAANRLIKARRDLADEICRHLAGIQSPRDLARAEKRKARR